MSKFSRFKALEVKGKTAEFVLHGLNEDPKPVLIVRPGGTENTPYLNALLREFGGQQQVSRLRASVDAGNLEKQREANRRLFPEFIVAGWKDVRDNDGNVVPYSLEGCIELFQQIPDYMVDDIRSFVEIPENFHAARQTIDVDAVAGN